MTLGRWSLIYGTAFVSLMVLAAWLHKPFALGVIAFAYAVQVFIVQWPRVTN